MMRHLSSIKVSLKTLIDEMKEKETKCYAVTGVENGSLVYAKDEDDAKTIFNLFYENERILSIRQINSIDEIELPLG